jgi:hypothetical protein
MGCYVFKAAQLDGVCTLVDFNVERVGPVKHGASRAKDWPKNPTAKMDPDYKKATKLADFLFCVGPPVISPKLRQAIEALGQQKIEFLPITILDHKKKVATKDYVVMNPLEIIDCVDIKASKVEWNDDDHTMIAQMDSLVLRESKIAKHVLIFRAKFMESDILVRSEVADALRPQGLTGLHFIEQEDYNG